MKGEIFMAKRLAGRPPKYDRAFYEKINKQHEEEMSLSQLAEHYGVSTRTATRWVKMAREMLKEKE